MFLRGCEKFDTALAFLFCLALAGSCLARFAYFLADLCTLERVGVFIGLVSIFSHKPELNGGSAACPPWSADTENIAPLGVGTVAVAAAFAI